MEQNTGSFARLAVVLIGLLERGKDEKEFEEVDGGGGGAGGGSNEAESAEELLGDIG